jgi:hypothetical protein
MLSSKLEDSSMMVGDSMAAVIINTTLLSSSLKKKHHGPCNYHCKREAIATWYICFGHIDTTIKVANICTKTLLAGPTFRNLTGKDLFHKPM